MEEKQWTLDEINKRYNEIITSYKDNSPKGSIPEASADEDSKIMEIYALFHHCSTRRKK